MNRPAPGAPRASWNDAFCAAAAPAIQKAWRRWQRHEEAWHAARAQADARAERRARLRLDAAALRLAAIPGRSLDDVAPKTLIAAWIRCWGGDTHVATMIEAAITADIAATCPEVLALDGNHD